MRHTRILLAALAAALVASAACTGDRPEPAPDVLPGASAFRAQPASSAEEAAAADTLARSGELVFAVHESLPRFGFTPTVGDDGVVSRIDVRPMGSRAATQALEVPENVLGGDEPADRFFVADINFDGYGDLHFVSDRGASNTISAYWLFAPGDRRFHFVDELPTVQVDAARQELTSHHRGGHAGRIFTASRFRWEGRRLVETVRETQDAVDGTTNYVFTVEVLQRGQLVEVRRDTLTEEEARSGPTWWDDEPAAAP